MNDFSMLRERFLFICVW